MWSLNRTGVIGDLDKSTLCRTGRESLCAVKREQEAVRDYEKVLEMDGGDGYIAM